MSDLSAPMVPADVDLRGLEYMPLLGARLFGSDFNLDATDTEFRIGLRLWWAAWNQVPAGSLPAQDNRLCKLAGLEEAPAKWRKVRAVALHGFVECSDGRLYHPVIADQALIAWEKRAEFIAERGNSTERKRRDRDERKAMFDALRAVGLVPPWDTKKDALRQLHAEHVTPPVTPPVTVTGHDPGHAPVTVTETAKTGRDGTVIQNQDTERAAPTVAARSLDDEPPGTSGQQPTAAGRVCRAMRQAGLQAVNPGDPRLAALLDQGITEAEFVGVAAEAVGGGKGWAWVLTVVQRRRADAAAIAIAPGGPPQQRGPAAPNTTVPSAAAERTQALLREQSQRAPDKPSPEVMARLAAIKRVPA